MKRIHKIIKYIDDHKLYPDLRIANGAAEPNVNIDGKDVIMFCSNNYLGLATHPKVVQAAVDATKKYGTGSDGSRLLSGNLKIHIELEEALTKFKGGEDAIVWPSGYSANIGVITAFMKPIKIGVQSFFERKGILISDQLNHASIIDGAVMSGVKRVIYKHKDMRDLEKKLKKYKNRRKLVVTDGVFSMDGDIAPLKAISKLCKKYNATSMVDEAHSTGILGKTGRGTLEHFNLRPIKDIDIVMGTCSKALASVGGFVVASKELVRFLRVASRSYMFSTAMTPASAAALIAVLNVIQTEPELRIKLKNNTERLKRGFLKLNFDICGSETQIIPVLVGKDEDAILFSRMLFKEGFFVPCVRWPAVEKNKARLRFTVMSTHTPEQIDALIEVCDKISKKIRLQEKLVSL